MELVYMWIKDYGHLKNIEDCDYLKNFEMNFGGKHLFNVKRKKIIDGNYELLIEKNNNPYHIDNFFNTNKDEANILNITAVIGENRTGKSTILEVIRSINSGSGYGFFILEEGKSKKGEKYFRTKMPDHKIEIFDSEKNKTEDLLVINELNFESIYFSNMLQTSAFKQYNKDKYLDLSTMRYLSEGVMQTKPLETALTEYNLAELNRQMDFVSNFYKIIRDDFEFEIPTQITISESHLFIDYKNKIDEKKITTLLNTDEDIKTKLMNFITKIDFSNLIIDRGYFTDNLHRIMKNMFIQWFISILNSEDLMFRNLENSILGYTGNHDFYSFLKLLDNNQLKSLLGIFDILVKIANNYHKDSRASSYEITDNIMGNFKKDKDKKNNIIELVQLLKSTDYTSNLLQFKWRDMSSGEMAILTLFSRFHSIRKELELSSNILILLDEPDMYLHPSWVQKFINVFIEYLNKDFSGKTIQIILTSNKPICTSDLPTNNVIRLEIKGYDKDNWPIVEVKKDDDYQSFGANIYSLYKDGFFFNEGFIGSFAKRKIQEVIKWLNNKRFKKPNMKYKKTIMNIGDPIIKHKLTQMYNDKMKMNNYEDRIDD
jgi:predicted ATP-dependent endonuclease of OLD family